MRKSFLLFAAIIIVLSALTLAGCNQQTAPSSSTVSAQTAQYKNVSPEEGLKAWQNKDGYFIDVRTPAEYAEGHIPGSKLIPVDEIPNRLSEIPKDGKIYLMCRSGSRSEQAAKIIASKGYSSVHSITGGMGQWRGPIEK